MNSGHGATGIIPSGGAEATANGRSLISARGVCLARGGRLVLERIDLEIAAGEIVTIIGPNGAGKTTLLRVLLGLVQPDRGVITRRESLSIGYAPQRFAIDPALPMTAERFLQLGKGRGARARIAAALQDVGAEHVRERQLSSLSGGELQRVVLARALMREPGLLVLDEPVGAVDFSGEAEFYDLIGRLRDEHGFGVLLVSHDLHFVMARSDRVVCINRHVCCSGVPQAISRDPAYLRLFGPDAAWAFAPYHHSHDHRHDISGETQHAPVSEIRDAS